MNKIFKVIWNHATQSWVAVSEFTKAHGKTKSVSLSKVAVGVTSALAVGSAAAATVETAVSNGADSLTYKIDSAKQILVLSTNPNSPVTSELSKGDMKKSILIGANGNMRPNSIKIGYNISDQSTGNTGDVVIGNNIQLGGGGTDSLSVAVGNNAQVAGPSVAIGTGARSDIASATGINAIKSGSVSIGAYAYTGGNINGGVAIGALATTAAADMVSIGIGSGLMAGSHWSNTDGSGTAVSFNERGGSATVSVGYESSARGTNAIAIGKNSQTGAMFHGSYKDSNSNNAISIGNTSTAVTNSSIAIGNGTQAGVYIDSEIATLTSCLTAAEAQVAEFEALVATHPTMTNDPTSAAVGTDEKLQMALEVANLERARIVVNRLKRDLASLKNTETALVSNKYAEGAIAIGNTSLALNENTIAMGNASKAWGNASIAIGNSNNVTGNLSIAVGDRNLVLADSAGAFGDPNYLTAEAQGSYVIGNNNTVNSADTFVLGSGVGRNNALTGNLSGTTIANSVYLGKDSEAADGTLGNTRTGTAGISQFTTTRAGGNTQTAGTSAYLGTEMVAQFVNQTATSGYTLADKVESFNYAKTGGDPAQEQFAQYAGTAPVGVVTVGASGAERRLVNVAAGLVSEKSTDAVNGSQLYAVAIQASRALTFYGNSNKDTDNNGTEQILGSSLRVIGATADGSSARDASADKAEGDYKARNVETVVSNGEVQIQFADKPTFAEVTLEDEVLPKPDLTENSAPTDNLDKAVSLGDVLNTGFNLQENGTAKDFVQPYDTLNFIDGNGTTVNVTTTDNKVSDIKYDVNIDNDTITINEDGQLVAKQPETTDLTNVVEGEENAGTIVPPSEEDGAKLVNATTVANAINNAGWVVTTDVDGGEREGADATKELVKMGEEVVFKAGKNLSIEQDGQNITYATVMNPTFNNVTTGGDIAADGTVTNPIYMGKDPDSGKNVITGLDPVLEDQGAAGTKPADINTSQAATLGDVLNAGWNLQVEGEAVDYVTPYNTVNFVGEGVTVEATPESDGETSTVKISIDTSGEVTDETTLENAPEDAKAGKVAPASNPNSLMTAQAVADAINASGFTLKNSAKGGEAPNADVSELINPGDTIEMIAGLNMKVEQEAEGGKITYSTVENPTFSNITTGGDFSVDEEGNVTVTNPIYMGKDDAGKNVITGLDVTLPENTTAGTKPADINTSQAATLGDVLNAGWNLQVEGEAVDFVTPYNTVNFVGINGVEVKANPASDGELSTIEIGIAKGGSVVEQSEAPVEDGEAPAEQTGKVVPTGDPDALMTAQAVADAINASGFTLKNSAKGGEAPNSDVSDLVNPGDVVEMIAGANLKVEQAGSNITYSTVMNPTFSNITTGGDVTIDENGNPVVNNPIYMGKNDAGDNVITGLTTTLPDPTDVTNATKPADINSSQAATLGDVLNAGWNLQVEGAPVDLVTPYNTVNFVGENGITVSADPASDGELSTVKISIDAAGSVLEQSEAPVADGEEPATQTGKVVPVGNPNALMNAQAVADAINASGFTLKHSATDGEDLGGDAELINPGDVIEMIAGKNLSVQQEADGKITYATKENVSFTEIKVGAPNEDGSENANPITIADNKITGLNTTLPSDINEDGSPVTNATKPADIDSSQAATLGDVLNAGWNLQANGEAVDLVTPYNIVNFIAGNGVTITPETDGETSSLTFSIDPSSLDMPSTIVEGSDTINVTPTTNENGDTVYTVAANTSPVVANENGSVDTPANPNALATAGDVANAINNSGWKATSGETGTGTVSGTTTELVKPSEEVKFIAGDNMVLAQNGQEFTYSVNPNPTFQTVTAEEGVTVGVPGSGTEVNMTPVAPVNVLDQDGNVAGNSTAPAVNMNGATFTGLAPNLPVTTSVQEGNIAPTTAMTPDLSNVNTSNAATLGDVLNAGWNLQANGDAVDFVKPYDTVNFAAGNGITVTPSTDGTTSTLTIAAETSPLTMNGATADNVGGDGTVATPANPNALATAGDVANAINNSGFDLDIGADASTNGQVTANDTAAARVNPGKKVTVNAGRNIEISRSGSDITVATSNDPVFNSVTANQVNIGPVTMTGSTGADGKAELSVGGARITNVAPGVNPTDAVNVSQLRGEIGNVHNRINKANKDLRAGIAGANAAVGLPQVYIPGKSMVAAAAGTYKGQSAIAVGYSRASDNGKLILKLQGNANTRGDVGGSIGVGYQW